MAKDPRQQSFWDEEALRLINELSPLVLRMLLAGAQQGESILPPELRVLIDWDVFNEQAIEYLRGYDYNLIQGITDTTRKQTVKAIDAWLKEQDPEQWQRGGQEIGEWIKSGKRLDALVSKLEPIFSADRAKRIAVTEVTRVYAEGNTKAWQATGMVQARKWQTARDERVCPICGPLHNTIADLGMPFYADGVPLDNPPAHPRCRCYIIPVVSREVRFI